MPDQPTPTTVADELAALRRIVAALDGLDQASQARAMRWLVDRYTPVRTVDGAALSVEDVTR